MPTEARYFLCTGECVPYEKLHEHAGSHIIGHLKDVQFGDDKKVTVLALWNLSVPTTIVPPVAPVIDVEIVGDARNIRCQFPGCGQSGHWEIHMSAFLALMRRIIIEYKNPVKHPVSLRRKNRNL